MRLVRQVTIIARIAALCAAAVWITSAFAGQNIADSRQDTPATAALPNTPPPATYTVLYNAPGDPNPAFLTGVVQGRDGNFYGGSYEGGANNLGSIYKITPAGVATVIYSLTSADGNPECNPSIDLLGTDGNFYGGCSYNSNGYIFKVTPAGVYTHLHDFTGTDGKEPFLTFQGSDGNFYGACVSGGSGGVGTVFKITPTGILTTIYSFASGAPYYQPAGMVQGKDGNFYGVTYTGSGTGGGVFKLTPGGVFTALHDFVGGATDGLNPSGFTQGTDGNFYGATQFGGVNNQGTIYKITAAGTFTLLHSFNINTDGGEFPTANLTQASDGNFYSTAVNCNQFGGCTLPENIFEITPAGVYTSLASFNITNGEFPFAGVIQDTSGIFYGVTDQGGTSGTGVFYSLNNSLNAFASLVSTSAKIGKPVGILGQGFSNSSVVKFGGVQATSVMRSGTTFLSATVPAGALSGFVTVTTGATTLTSNKKFSVTPTITSFSPPSGPVGTPVTITGTGLTQTTKVTFNGTVATFTVNSDTQVSTTVPAGATTGKIAVTTTGGTAKSSTSFTVN